MDVYFDASESREGYFTVAGYIFEQKNVRPFDRLWRRMLKTHDIDHFHMTDCNMQQGVFKGMSKDECDQCSRRAIRAISMKAAQGIVVAIQLSDFERLAKPEKFMPSPFSLCAHSAVMMCAQWGESDAPGARFFYVFESGDAFESDVNQLLNALNEDPARSKWLRYQGHTFRPKKESYAVQAADVLAWHSCKQWARDDRGQGLRGDFEELVRNVPTRKFLWSEAEINHSVEAPNRIHGIPNVGEIAGLALRRTKANAKVINREIAKRLKRDS